MAGESGIERRRQAALAAGGHEYLERRERILRAAATLFFERGYQRTSFGDIAKYLEVDRASLYYYVGNKSDLFEAVAMVPLESNVRELERIHASDRSAPEKIRAVIVQLMASFEANYPGLYVLIRDDLARLDVDTERSARATNLKQRYMDLVIAMVRDGQDKGELRSHVSANVLGESIIGMLAWSHKWFRPGGSPTGHEIGVGLTSVVLDGLMLREDDPGHQS